MCVGTFYLPFLAERVKSLYLWGGKMEWPIRFINFKLKHAHFTCYSINIIKIRISHNHRTRLTLQGTSLFWDIGYLEVVEALISLWLETLSINTPELPRMHVQVSWASVSLNKCCEIQLSWARKSSKYISNHFQLTCADRSKNLFVNPAHFLQREGKPLARVNAAILNFERMNVTACAQIEPAENISCIAGSSGHCEV